MPKRDYYEILGVPKGTTEQEIKSAYRKQALQWHPDRNKTPEATAKFKEVTEAYEILSNPEKKAAYDQFGHAAFEQGMPGGAGPFGGQGGTYRQGPFTYSYSTYGDQGGGFESFGGGNFTDPFEIFEQFFGGASPFGNSRRQQRSVYSIEISFMEAVKGVEKEVRLDGKTKKIKIPAGVDDGIRIRFDDFDLLINVRPDSTFHRDGDDLYVDQTISFSQATLGTSVRVPTLDGSLELRIKPGTQPGTLIRLRGQGVPHVRGGGRGDEYVRIKMHIPTKLSRRARELLEILDTEIGHS